MIKDFSGFNGFQWFKGVVENRQDPLKLGRVQIRIIGLHSELKTLIPTDSLPWATIMLPVNGARTLSVPKEGEWVIGFFEDGKNAQRPVILGIEPGIIPQKVANINSQYGFLDPRTQTEIDSAPKIPTGQVADTPGKPSTPPTAREEVANTAIDVANNNLAHVCDVRQYIKLDNSSMSIKFNGTLKKIRDAIRSALAALGIDPSGVVSYIVSFLKSVAREVGAVAKLIRNNLLDLLRITDVIGKIKAMIQYILSLPAKLLAMLQDCLSALLGAISSMTSNLLSLNVGNVNATSELNEIVTAINDTISASKDAAEAAKDILNIPNDVATAIASATTNVITPSSTDDINAASISIQTAISGYAPSQEIVIADYTYSSANTQLP